MVGGEKSKSYLESRRRGVHDAIVVVVDFGDCKVATMVKKSGRWQGLRGSRHCSVPVGMPAGNCCGGCRWISGDWELRIGGCWQTVGIGKSVA